METPATSSGRKRGSPLLPSLGGASPCHGGQTLPSFLLLLLCLLYALPLTCGQGDEAVKFRVVEEESSDSPVGTVSTSSQILNKVPEADRSAVQYSLDARNVRHQNLFKIERHTGDISVAQPVDRETVCPRTDDCILHFDAIAIKDDIIVQVPIVINVTDINDNKPEFHTIPPTPPGSLPTLEVCFPESSPSGSLRPLLTATDEDMSSPYGDLSYSLEPASSIFSLDISENSVGTEQVNLRLEGTLDREKVTDYTLQLVARDGGEPPNTGTLKVKVLVEDFNDNPPKFTQTLYTANFSETEGKGYEIVKVHATDKDEDQNGRVVYFLSSQQPGGNPESILDKVDVNKDTGSVTLKQSLSSGTYTIRVEARDMGNSFLSDQTEIELTVLDTDNNEPVMRLSAALGDESISEAKKVGDVVGYLAVDDPDSGSNGHVTCRCLESHFKLKELSGSGGTYSLLLARSLDFETAQRHEVEVVCEDQGSPSLNATDTLIVNVADENDNEPEFTKNVYTQGIFENNIAGDTVVVVTATDPDKNEKGRVTYQLLRDAGNNFTISPYDGVIKTTIRFDRETKDVYEFTVLAVDGGEPPLNATALVRIEIRDKNDEPPVFGRPHYKFHLYENRDADSVVGNITVSDPDLQEGGKIKLSLVFDNSDSEAIFGLDNGDNDPFSISDDGKIFSREVFDREEKSSYSFFIVATDQGQRKLSSSVQAVVEILDVNDHRPAFSFPSEHNFSALATIPIASDQSVLRVEVTDMDAGKNRIVSYSIVSTNASAGLFRIGKFSGEIVASRDLGRADLGTFFITVNASDQGSPPLWENRTVILVLQAAATGSSDDVIADQNVLIVVCIVCFTVIVSGGIFIALCVLRRLDRQRKLQYAGSCCPGNRSDLDSGSNGDSGPQQYDLALSTGKECSSKDGSVSSPYHQYPNHPDHPPHKTGPARDGGEGHTRTPGMFRRAAHTGYDPAMGGRAVPLSSSETQRNKAPAAPGRQEDHHSTSSTETAAGDSGHGSDEEFSSSLDHSSAQATLPPSGAAKPTFSSFGPAAGATDNSFSRSVYPPNVSHTSSSSSLRGRGAGQFPNPGAVSNGRGSSKAFPYTDRGSLSSTLSRSETPQQQQQQQYPMTVIPPQKRKNSSVRFQHPLVTDISSEQAGTANPQVPLSTRSGITGSSNSVSGYSTGTPPPPPPSRQPKQQQPPQYQPQHQLQTFQQRQSSIMLPSYPKQHSLLPPMAMSSTSSSPVDVPTSKRTMRLHSSLDSGGRMRQLSPLSPGPRSPHHHNGPGLGLDHTEESDLNTTTSGSYSVASDDVECRLNDFGETGDAYV